MLRVFKVRSPMSVGAWTLVAFSSAGSILTRVGWLEAGRASALASRP
jgi:hypothetical protein